MNLETQVRIIQEAAPDCVGAVMLWIGSDGSLMVGLADKSVPAIKKTSAKVGTIDWALVLCKWRADALQREYDAGEREKYLGMAEREGELLANSSASEKA